MKQILPVLSFLLLITLLGCGNKNMGDESQTWRTLINEHMGSEVQVPEYEDLDISKVYVTYHKNGEPTSFSIVYTQDKGDLNEHFTSSENRREFEEVYNSKILYDKFDGDESIRLHVQKGIESVDYVRGERININDIEVAIEETIGYVIHQYHVFVYENNRYIIGYHLDHYTEEEAIRYTQAFVEKIPKQK